MKRSSVLKAVAAMPVLGALLPKMLVPATESESEVLSTSYALLTRGGMYMNNVRVGIPTAEEVTDAGEHGFDRFDIVSNIRGIIYQGRTIPGKTPVGWPKDFAGGLMPWATAADKELLAPQSWFNR